MSAPEPAVGMANPASVNCAKQGGTLRFASDENGTVGICVFKDGSECEEWALMRGSCSPPGAPAAKTAAPSPWVVGAIALGIGLAVGAGAMHLSMRQA